MPSTASTKLGAALLLALTSIAQANRLCNTARFPGCSAPFPPGHRNMGDAWWGIGAQDKGTVITQMKTTLLLNDVPQNNQGVMAINTALENSNRDDWSDAVPMDETYQTLTVAYPPGWNACDQAADEWCVFPSLFNRPADPQQFSAQAVSKKHNYGVVLQFDYAAQGKEGTAPGPRITQVADGIGISNLTQQAPWQFWPKTECQCGANGVIPAHSYMNTVLTIDPPVADWGNTVSFNKATAGTPKSDDNGKTWTIDWIDIEDSMCSSDTVCETATTATKRSLFGRRSA